MKLRGIIHVMGDHDVGKTTFALECGAEPKKIVFLDDDVKGQATIRDMQDNGIEFGRYINLTNFMRGTTELDFHNKVMQLITKDLDNTIYDTLIWDTWTNFANTCHSYVTANPSKFRRNWSSMGQIKGAQEWQEARRLEREILNDLGERFDTVILITHLKDSYVNKVKIPGKMQPASSSVLESVPRLRLWLRHNPNGRPVPIALVMKRLERKIIVNGALRTVNVLPRRIAPTPDQHSVWDAIWYYWNNPLNDREPTTDESPNEFELSLLDKTLTADQKIMFNNILAAGEIEAIEEAAIDVSFGEDTLGDKAKFLLAQGKPKPVVAKELSITLTELNELLSEEK
jgi:hypothetical protein